MKDMNRQSKDRPCPSCGRAFSPDFFPFCSDRCRLMDLSGWLTEAYTIPAEEPPDDDPQSPDR